MILTKLTSSQVTYNHGGTGSETRNLGGKLRDVVSILDFIPVTTNPLTDDCSVYIDNALNSGASKVTAPTGEYLLGTPFTIPEGVIFYGDRATLIIASTLTGSGTQNNAAIITLTDNSHIQGFIFRTQTQVVLNATTTSSVEHPWLINASGASYFKIKDIEFHACWRGIVMGTSGACETPTIDGIKGVCYQTGIYIDQCSDVPRLNNVHFNPNYSTYTDSVNFTTEKQVSYIRDTVGGFAIHINKADWAQLSNVFIYGYNTGLRLQTGVATLSGNATISMSNSGIDGCKYDVVSTGVVLAQFSNMVFASTEITGSEVNKCVVIDGTGNFSFSNCSFLGSAHDICVDFSGTQSINLTNCVFYDYVKGIVADSGYLTIDSPVFNYALGQTVYDIELSGTAKAYINNARRIDGTAIVTSGITSTTAPNTFDTSLIRVLNSPVYSINGISSSAIAPVEIANGATHSFVTFPAGDATYLVYAGQDASSTAAIRAIAFVRTGSTDASVSVLANNACTIAVISGLTVGVTNSAGGSAFFTFGYLKLLEQ